MGESSGGAGNTRPFTRLRPMLWDGRLSILTKKPVSSSFTRDNGPRKPLMAAMFLFREKRWALQPIDRGEKSSGTSIMEMQNTQWCSGTMCGGTSFTASPSFRVWGERGEARYPRRKTEEVCEKVQLLLLR